jgi:hypothetical protein
LKAKILADGPNKNKYGEIIDSNQITLLFKVLIEGKIYVYHLSELQII